MNGNAGTTVLPRRGGSLRRGLVACGATGVALALACYGLRLSYDRGQRPADDSRTLASAHESPNLTSETTRRESFKPRPIVFEANRGQTHPDVRFLSVTSSHSLFLTPQEAVLALRSAQSPPPSNRDVHVASPPPAPTPAVVRIKWVGGKPEPVLSGEQLLPGRSHHLIGNDPAKWVGNVPLFSRVRYEGIYDGVDLVFHGSDQQLEYDFEVSPGADPNVIELAVVGIQALKLEEAGGLILETTVRPIHHSAPNVYQTTDGERRTVSGRFVARGKNRIGFQVASYDNRRALVIDPRVTLLYSTYLGGSTPGWGDDYGESIALDSAGNIFITGNTAAADFPTQNPFQGALAGYTDAFITKFSPDGQTLVFSTYLGGSSFEAGLDIAVDGGGRAYVTGNTSSEDFPTVRPLQDRLGGSADAFVAELAPDGSALLFSTYAGGALYDTADALDLDSERRIALVGHTDSADYPTTPGSFQPRYAGNHDVFITVFRPHGSGLDFSTFLGGSMAENGLGIAVDQSGAVYVTGDTYSRDFPLEKPFQGTFRGIGDVFLTKLSPDGAALVYSTYLGGESNCQFFEDIGYDIAVDALGSAYVTGETCSHNFPTRYPFQGQKAGWNDAFLSKFTPGGENLVYSTYLGGADFDMALVVSLDTSARAYIMGGTFSRNFPVYRAAQWQLAGDEDGFATVFSPDGQSLIYSTYLGGTGWDRVHGGVASPCRRTYAVGFTGSSDFPLRHPYQDDLAGVYDAFVAVLGPPVEGCPD